MFTSGRIGVLLLQQIAAPNARSPVIDLDFVLPH